MVNNLFGSTHMYKGCRRMCAKCFMYRSPMTAWVYIKRIQYAHTLLRMAEEIGSQLLLTHLPSFTLITILLLSRTLSTLVTGLRIYISAYVAWGLTYSGSAYISAASLFCTYSSQVGFTMERVVRLHRCGVNWFTESPTINFSMCSGMKRGATNGSCKWGWGVLDTVYESARKSHILSVGRTGHVWRTSP